MVVKMLFCVTFSALVLVSSAFFLKNEHPTKEIGFNQSHSQGVGFNFFANIADAEACSCKNGRCVKDNKGNWKCLCNPRHSMQGTDCAECYCGKKGKCIFTETFNKETLKVQYEKKCVCDSGYADKNGICVECGCGVNSKCEFENGEKNCYCADGFAEKDGVCTECDCGEGGYCEFHNGEKQCTCYDGYVFDGQICAECDCGPDGTCTYENGEKKCACMEGYSEMDGTCELCNCGSGGFCSFEGNEKVCTCDAGFSIRNDICEECDCGSNGICYFGEGQKVCKCDDGYSEKNGRCEVCDCGKNSICKFIHGAKACDCLSGYSMNVETGVCTECNCGNHGSCAFVFGEKKCYCDKGYEAEDGICQECDCGSHGRCSLKNSRKSCECEEHFKETDGKCIECYCGEHGECSVLHGKKICSCDIGYLVNNGKCEECDCGKHGSCEFINGLRTCICKKNFSAKNGKCKETCSSDVDCYNGGGCFEEEGGKFCECLPETSGDRCETISECVEGNLRNCRGDNGTCAYDRAKKTAVCLCERGKAFDPSADICKECKCGARGTCEFRHGRKTCICEKKYAERDGRCTETCWDNGDCYNGGWCLDYNGGKFCDCFWGLSGDRCEIIDDCVTGKYKDCREDRGTCSYDDTDKTAVCVCPEGKVLHPTKNVCRNECNDCENGGMCHQDEGGNFCTCLPGTSGHRCEIVNDCVDGIYRDCRSSGGTCTYNVTQKNAVCLCGQGKAFDFIENRCKECDCGTHGDCEIRQGRKICKCEDKYEDKDGICTKTCRDNRDCYNGGWCLDHNGSKFCNCFWGLSGDRCEIIDDCVTGKYKDCREDRGTCRYDDTDKTAVCVCPEGKVLHPTKNVCRNECNDCENGGMCHQDEAGNFCTCLPGTSGHRCEIVNDCVDGIYKHCRSSGGTCTYNIGQKNAVCLCGQGKALNLTEYRCRECNCGAHGDCEIRQGHKICKCEDKYADKDGFCTEKCRDNRDCYNGGWCLDHNGSKFCNCFWGLSGDKCEIIDDCVTGKYKDCREDRGTCIYDGIDKTAVCVCPKGKVLHPNKNVCKDECNDCQNGGTCHQDEVGNFCTCLHGTSGRRCEIVNECVDGIYRHCTSVGGICMFDVIQKNATCICSEGKAFDLIQNKCKECNCGEHGKCEFRYGLKVCICEEKYGEKNGLCTEMCNYDGDCVNGGKCIDFQKGKFCNCLQGLSGDKCEIVDDCYSGKYKNCRNGNGECKYNFDKMTAVCTCPGRKVYDLKENMCKDPNPCEPSPCVNGHCVAQMHDFECICDNPYTGRYCEISTCIQTKCFGGKCKLYGNREECHCPQGHRLENGTCLKNYCVETKCFNGKCLIENGVETCVCEDGYVYEGNECRKAKCSLRHCIGGECRILRGNLEECVCPSGFILIDGICTITSCTPRTCYGGRCERREGHLVCICPVGFHLEGVGCTETQCKEQNCFGGHCRVIKGEEICTCLDNYVLKDNQCQKTRCVVKSCFGGKCDVVDGEEVCSCPVGFEPHGDVCREI